MPYATKTIYSCDLCGQEISEATQEDYVFRFKRGQYNEDTSILPNTTSRRNQGWGLWICVNCQVNNTISDLILLLDQGNGDNNE